MAQTSADNWQGVGHRIKLNFIQKLERRTRRIISAAGMASRKHFFQAFCKNFDIPLWGETKVDLWAALSSHGGIEDERINVREHGSAGPNHP